MRALGEGGVGVGVGIGGPPPWRLRSDLARIADVVAGEGRSERLPEISPELWDLYPSPRGSLGILPRPRPGRGKVKKYSREDQEKRR